MSIKTEYKPSTAYARYTGGNIYVMFGKCKGVNVWYKFSSEDEGVYFYDAPHEEYEDDVFDSDFDAEKHFIEWIEEEKLQDFLSEVFGLIENKEEHHRVFDNYIAEEIAEIRIHNFGNPQPHREESGEPELKTYKIYYTLNGTVEIEAESEDIARELFYDPEFTEMVWQSVWENELEIMDVEEAK